MATTLKDKVKALSAERRAQIDTETDRLHDEHKTQQELQKATELTEAKIEKVFDAPLGVAYSGEEAQPPRNVFE